MGDWLNWGQPLSDFSCLPDWLLYEKWILIGRSRAEEINAQSRTIAQLTAHFTYWSQCHNNPDAFSVEYPKADKFLPFQFPEPGKEPIDEETAKIVCKANKLGMLPGDIAQVIAHVMPDNWAIIQSFEK